MIDYLAAVAFLIATYAILAIGLNITIGFAGVFSLAHAAFFAAGAYTCALTAQWMVAQLGSPTLGPGWYLLCGPVAIGVSVGLSILFGLLTIRLENDFFLMATLGLAELIRMFISASETLGGYQGIRGIPEVRLGVVSFSTTWGAALTASVFAALAYGFSRLLESSRLGLAFFAVREDGELASVCGENPRWLRVRALATGAALAAVAGWLVAPYYTYIDPGFFGLPETILVLTMVLIGGLGRTNGAVSGALALVLLLAALQQLPMPSGAVASVRQLIFGLLLVGTVLLRPSGILRERRG